MYGKKGRVKFELSGAEINAPTEWQDMNILAQFDNDNVQANISTDTFTFVLDAYTKLIAHIDDGLTGGVGIFESPEFKIIGFNDTNNELIFSGMVDLASNIEIDEFSKTIKSKIKKDNGLNSLDDRLSALTYGWLENQGYFKNSDYKEIEYVVEKKINSFEILTTSIIMYLMLKEIAEASKDTSEKIAVAQALVAQASIGSGISAALYAVAVAIIQVAYTALLLATVVDLGKNLINTFVLPKRKAKTISLEKLISEVARYLGYSFETTVSDMSKIYYLPSNLQFDEVGIKGFVERVHGTEKGIPNVTDYGYSVIDMFNLVRTTFNGRFAIVDDVLHFHNEYSDFWLKQSTFVLPNVQLRPTKYNTDFNANFLVEFNTDSSDDWTIDNFLGTVYEVITEAKIIDVKKRKALKGLERITVNCALGNKKTSLNAFEKFLRTVANVMDGVIDTFGGNGNLEKSIKDKVNILKISSNNYNLPKLLRYSGDNLQQRNLLSAKYLYDNYYFGRSMVENSYFGQKKIYENIKIPFGFNDFLNFINNSYFYTQDGKVGKMEKIEYNINGDFAICSFWIREPYTYNLKEIKIEP